MALRSVSTIVCSAHYGFTVCINNNQDVLSIGYSPYGAHGHEDKEEDEGLIFPPEIIAGLKNIISISVGRNHSACLDNHGNIFVFGSNEYGQLGIDLEKEILEYTHVPQKVNLPPCKQISGSDRFTICLSESGEVYSFGSNEEGVLGLGDINNEEIYNSPQLISSLKDVEFIECGGWHTFCKTLNNEIFCWGLNYYGQLGLRNNNHQNTPILCSSLSNEDVIDIKCGYEHTLVLTSNGDVLSCGNNDYGQLGRETDNNRSTSFQKIEKLSDIIRIECGYCHSLCIDTNNDLYVFGNNYHGQLGLGDDDNRNKPIKHPSLSNIIDISNGGISTFVKTSNNEIYAFGYNSISQLGIKTEQQKQLTPIRVFEDNEDIWFSSINKSNAKSARSILPRPSNEDDNSPPKKKQKT